MRREAGIKEKDYTYKYSCLTCTLCFILTLEASISLVPALFSKTNPLAGIAAIFTLATFLH